MKFYLLFVKILTFVLSLAAFILYVVFAALPLTIEERGMGLDQTRLGTGYFQTRKDSLVTNDYRRLMGPLTYTVNFCSTDMKPVPVLSGPGMTGSLDYTISPAQDVVMCLFSKSTVDRYLYQAYDIRYQALAVQDSYVTFYHFTTTENSIYTNPTGDTKAFFDMLVSVGNKQFAAFILALLAAVGSFAIMAGSVYTNIICRSKIFLVITAVVSASLGIAAAALSTTSFPKGNFLNVNQICTDARTGCTQGGTVPLGSTVTMNYDFTDVYKLSNGAAVVIVAIIVSFVSLVPPLFAKDEAT